MEQPSISVTLDAYHQVEASCLVNGHVDLPMLVLKIEGSVGVGAGGLSRSNVEFVRDLALCANHEQYMGSDACLPQERALELAGEELLVGR